MNTVPKSPLIPIKTETANQTATTQTTTTATATATATILESKPSAAAAPQASAPTKIKGTSQHNRCKRCSRQVQFTETAWKEFSGDPTSVETMLQTLPDERCKELATMLASRGQTKSIVDLSRFFNQSLRTDTVSRLPNGSIARKIPHVLSSNGMMRGPMALVLDNNEGGKGIDVGRRAGSSSPVSSDAEGTASGELVAGGGNSGSQGDSFILLSSSQLRTQPLVGSASDNIFSSPLQQQNKNFLSMQKQQQRDETGLANEPMSNDDGTKDGDIAETFEAIGLLMDKLEERSVLEHPMCEDCAETMLRLLDREIIDCAHENGILEGVGRAAEMELKKNDTRDVGELEKELARQADLERALEETLGTLDTQLEGLFAQIQELDKESDELDKLEARVNQELNDKSYVLERCEAEQWALDDRYARLAAQLTQLQRTNVFNDVFNISVSEGVASINGFRLGGRSSHGVEWPEINAAWGQALLMLQTVARRLEYEFIDYRLVAMGSFSRIERTAEPMATYELFGSGDLYLGRLFQSRRFDSAMVAFLACLDQLSQLIVSINPQLRIPYRIEQDKVGGVSIRPQFGQDDVWTRACKNTLMNARWALAFASSYTNSDTVD